MTRMLLAGATGTPGSQVMAQLRERDDCPVTTFERDTRHVRKQLSPLFEDARCVFGDITLPEHLAAACVEVDVAIHLAALIPPAGRP